MAHHCSSVFSMKLQLIKVFLSLATIKGVFGNCYSSIFSFGDSLTDTGNIYFTDPTQHCLFPPYGESYFTHPTGRCCNGRLVLDFTAQTLGLPLIKPYLGVENGSTIQEGVNFAVVGATALDASFFFERGIDNVSTNDSLSVQLDWFKKILPSLCNTSSECNEIFGSSLFLMGEIGGNDYNYPFFLYRSIEEIQTFVPLVIKAIASAINELIELGAVTLMVPGNLPIGCSAAYLTYYETADTDQYDPETGCLNWLNKFSEYHNDQLQKELSRIQALHPHTNIIYADFYNSSMRFYRNPSQYGFTGGAHTACCGGGGPYNFNTSAECGDPSVSACDDPSKYVSWDGVHLTEAAYQWITNGLLEGPYTIPQISISCVSQDA
ncbi:GDSL esterase/lipase At1g28580-like isoform X1 [Quercus robur]|uniref:GDSL esterase/lipase At1g28580-like isoform X1 n=1 Tax=Quercus robur TaxID=38942 RepID=UPI002163EF5D|nr:GDSL esterase/lipase At1g28580-like isoform X1 [Quercus robur]